MKIYLNHVIEKYSIEQDNTTQTSPVPGRGDEGNADDDAGDDEGLPPTSLPADEPSTVPRGEEQAVVPKIVLAPAGKQPRDWWLGGHDIGGMTPGGRTRGRHDTKEAGYQGAGHQRGRTQVGARRPGEQGISDAGS